MTIRLYEGNSTPALIIAAYSLIQTIDILIFQNKKKEFGILFWRLSVPEILFSLREALWNNMPSDG